MTKRLINAVMAMALSFSKGGYAKKQHAHINKDNGTTRKLIR